MKNQHTATLAGYEIPRLGMGTMALAIEGRPTNRNQAIETIHAALMIKRLSYFRPPSSSPR